MRRLVAGLLVMAVGFVSVALGAQARTVREVAALVKEIEGKAVGRAGTSINVKAAGCSLCIEFKPQSVIFDLPLQSANVVASELEDGLIITNVHMTRTIPSRTAESFARLELRFGRNDLGQVKSLFEQAIQACRS